MSSAIHCDGPSCKEWTTSSTGEAGYILIQKKYKTKHFCSWVCTSDWLSQVDLVTGPGDMA